MVIYHTLHTLLGNLPYIPFGALLSGEVVTQKRLTHTVEPFLDDQCLGRLSHHFYHQTLPRTNFMQNKHNPSWVTTPLIPYNFALPTRVVLPRHVLLCRDTVTRVNVSTSILDAKDIGALWSFFPGDLGSPILGCFANPLLGCFTKTIAWVLYVGLLLGCFMMPWELRKTPSLEAYEPLYGYFEKPLA